MIHLIALQVLGGTRAQYSMTSDLDAFVSSASSSTVTSWGGVGSFAMGFHLRPVRDNASPRNVQVWLQRTPTVQVFASGAGWSLDHR